MTKPLPPWMLTPEQFGKSYPPMRVIGTANHPEWRYLEKLPARDTRVAAVQDAHRHFVERALEEGCAVPDHVAELYRPATPPTTPKVQAEPDYIRLVAERPNEATAAPERAAIAQAVLAKCLAEAERERDRLVGAALLAHDDAMTLHRTVATGLTKALTEQTERAERTRADMREDLADREAELKETIDRLDAAMRQQAKILAAARKPKAKPKKWTFKITRDTHGNIAGLDAEPC